ncbi:MAG: peptidylprolyl isomerase [Actinomycetota bacterium]|nr:peptidylprolyl isomerase [Actinomycetota bacterium]
MHKKARIIDELFVALCALLLLTFAGCSGGAFIRVNGQAIPEDEFRKEVEIRLEATKKKNPRELEGEKGKKLMEETKRQVATDLIRDALMEQQAKELNVPIPSYSARERIEREKREKGYDDFANGLREQGLTEEKYREKIAKELLVEELGKEVTGGLSVAPEEVENFYLTNKGLFGTAESVHVAHILLESDGEAKGVEARLKKGEDFSALAKAFSSDDATGPNGGDLGWIERGTMEPVVEEAAFSLPTGGVSGVVKASDGYHLIKVLERRPEYIPPFEEVKEEVEKVLLTRKKEEAFADWLKTVYANAKVELPGEIGKWDPYLGMVIKK